LHSHDSLRNKKGGIVANGAPSPKPMLTALRLMQASPHSTADSPIESPPSAAADVFFPKAATQAIRNQTLILTNCEKLLPPGDIYRIVRSLAFSPGKPTPRLCPSVFSSSLTLSRLRPSNNVAFDWTAVRRLPG
jgi:hypothetical protein